MSSGGTPARVSSIGLKLVNTVFVSLLVTTGLLMAPVTCTCGASTPHGHSLFQLPFHNHRSTDHPPGSEMDHAGHSEVDVTAMSAASDGDECDDGSKKVHTHPDGFRYVALSNAMEKQDGAVLQAPPSSSLGQLVAFAQPTPIALSGQDYELLTLPPTRTLEGLEPSPETPPPRLSTAA